MKAMKKVLSALLVAIMLIAASTTAFAAGNGRIVVNGTTNGKTYDIYKIFDLTQAAGAGGSVSYTVDPDWENFFFNGGEGESYLLTSQSGSLNQLTYNGTTYYINITDSNVAEFAQKALEYAADKTPDESKTATGSSVTFQNLDLGYYLVYPQGATDIGQNYGSICSLTSTVPNATVNVKATYPKIDKEVDEQNTEVGQVVTFTVTGKVPDTTGYSTYKYEVRDTMSAGLTFNAEVSNFSIEFGGTVINETPVYANNGFTLTFDMTNYQDYKGQAITITYSAVVNKNAVAALTKNSATLTYSNDPATPTSTETTPPVQEEVYTSKIVVDKRDTTANGKKLKDASFILVKKDSGVESFYKYDASTDTVSWVDNEDDATVKTTDNNGAAEFIGLKDGIYYLRETVAPAGFNLLADDVEVTISHTTVNQGGQTFSVGVSQTSQILNKAGTTLPQTGGVGTTIFYVLGGVLLIGGVIAFITRRKLKAGKD